MHLDIVNDSSLRPTDCLNTGRYPRRTHTSIQNSTSSPCYFFYYLRLLACFRARRGARLPPPSRFGRPRAPAGWWTWPRWRHIFAEYSTTAQPSQACCAEVWWVLLLCVNLSLQSPPDRIQGGGIFGLKGHWPGAGSSIAFHRPMNPCRIETDTSARSHTAGTCEVLRIYSYRVPHETWGKNSDFDKKNKNPQMLQVVR